MDFEVWEGYYRQILDEFGFSREEDERSAAILSKLLVGKKLVTLDEIKALILNKEVVVIGGSRNLEKELDRDISQEVVIAADGTTSQLLRRALVPDIIVTDLDGNIEDQISANKMGAIAVIHAHGDNIEQIETWTPRFEDRIMGTVQCRPFGTLHNFGGFTDGDRAVFLAEHFRANSIRLMGFDFENVGDKPNCDRQTKLRKLQWAKKLIISLGVQILLDNTDEDL